MGSSTRQKTKLTMSQVLCACGDGCNAVAISSLLGYTSSALISMEEDKDFEISPEQESWIGAAIPGMALIGSLVAGLLIERFEKRHLMIAASLPSFLAWVCTASSVNANQVIAARLLNGLCLGIQQVTMTVFMSETVHPQLRPMLKLIPTISMMLGFLVMNIAGSITGWREMAWMGAALNLPLFLILWFLPSTPYFLLKFGKNEEAYECLKWLRSTEKEAHAEFKDLQVSLSPAKHQPSVTFFELMIPPYRWSFSVAILLHVFQQATGISSITTFMGLILERSGSSIGLGSISTVMTVINISAIFVVSKCLAKYPLKLFIKYSSQIMVISLLVLSGYLWARESDCLLKEVSNSLTFIPSLSIILYVAGFSFGWAPIPWIFIGIGLPLRIRGKGAGIVTASNWGFNFIVTKTFIWLTLLLPSYCIFLMYASFAFFGQIIMTYYLPETVGLSDVELERYYKDAYKKKNI